MNHSTTAIRFRFSAAQMSVLWPGLDLIITLRKERNIKGGIRFEYPFRMYPPPAGFDRGAFDQEMMDEILALWERLHPKSQTGGRMQMKAVELRAAIFAIQANISYVRRRRNDCGTKSPAPKNEPLIDDQSFEQLKIESKRVIHSLERRMKRANNALCHRSKAVILHAITLNRVMKNLCDFGYCHGLSMCVPLVKEWRRSCPDHLHVSKKRFFVLNPRSETVLNDLSANARKVIL